MNLHLYFTKYLLSLRRCFTMRYYCITEYKHNYAVRVYNVSIYDLIEVLQKKKRTIIISTIVRFFKGDQLTISGLRFVFSEKFFVPE